jgi:hypothetical protein
VTSLTADVVANATEIVTSMRTVRSMGAEEKEKKRFSKNIDHLNKFILGKSISGGSLFGLLTFCLWCDVAVSFLYVNTFKILIIRVDILSVGDITLWETF